MLEGRWIRYNKAPLPKRVHLLKEKQRRHLLSLNVASRFVVFPACSLLLSSLSVFLIYIVQTKVQSLVLSCVFGGVSVITWNSLDVVGTELYPTKLR